MSEKSEPIEIRQLIARSSLIVLAHPEGVPRNMHIKIDGADDYEWTVQPYRIDKTYYSDGAGQPDGTQGAVIHVSSLDETRLQIAQYYAQGIRKIAMYQIYTPLYPAEEGSTDPRILFLVRTSLPQETIGGPLDDKPLMRMVSPNASEGRAREADVVKMIEALPKK